VITTSGERRFVSLSQSDDHSVTREGTILARSGQETYRYVRRIDGGGWEPTTEPLDARKEIAGNDFRVFLETLQSGSYRNIVMIRRARGVGTSRLFPPPSVRYEPIPVVDEPVDLAYFTHGLRTGEREVSLVFNAIDDVEGLTEILMTLATYDLRATFFVNGEFIRRHPAALAEIAEAGHEVGSLFFAYFDMADRRFQITRDFILEGLSRNEDEYFAATGRELSLLWHAPYYFVSDDIVEWGQAANYIYVGRDVDSLDWVPRITQDGLSDLYMPAADLVERVLDEKRPGSIISMEIGTAADASGGREDYLFQKLDVLINGLLAQGYSIVPISTMLENAQ
jgi:peptidoglycan/xylan/chitin deacetylase (PgdA/CDA1 family)